MLLISKVYNAAVFLRGCCESLLALTRHLSEESDSVQVMHYISARYFSCKTYMPMKAIIERIIAVPINARKLLNIGAPFIGKFFGITI